ncbi:MAG: hypothetical protein HYU66_14820 [Armatimonadetes bacterium]|nr:hypothetical protein [Armatimonadota bacterium]
MALLVVASAWATPTGLNNIPTADVTPDRTVVLQAFGTVGDSPRDQYVLGFKWGFQLGGQRFEGGLDGRLGEGDAGPALFQFKYSLPTSRRGPVLGLGVANLAVTEDDRRRAGEAFKYVVVSHDWGPLRSHAGYGLQPHNNAFLLGLDRTFHVGRRDVMLRGDLTQIQDQSQWLGSLGAIWFADPHLAVEGWVSQPFDRGRTTFTLKLDGILSF